MHGKMLNITNHQGNANGTTVRYHLTPVTMAIDKKTKISFGEDGRKGNPCALLVEYKLLQPLWKTVWQSLKKLQVELLYDPEFHIWVFIQGK